MRFLAERLHAHFFQSQIGERRDLRYVAGIRFVKLLLRRFEVSAGERRVRAR